VCVCEPLSLEGGEKILVIIINYREKQQFWLSDFGIYAPLGSVSMKTYDIK